MNKNGFTLVELLAVIALMAIIIVLAVPATGAVKDKLNEYMLEKKIKLIEKGAILYGEDFIEDNTNKGSYLDDNEILIYKENEIVKAIFITNEDKLDNKYICS